MYQTASAIDLGTILDETAAPTEGQIIPTIVPKPWPQQIAPITPDERSALEAIFPEAALDVLTGIENIEFSWRMDAVPFPPSYGRESADELVLPWSIPRSTGWLLYGLIMATGPKSILELGTSLGYSTLWLCAAATRTGAEVHTVELMQEKAIEARRNLAQAGFHNWTLYERDADDVSSGWRAPIDFLFLDADAASYLRYWQRLVPHLSPVATVVVDNALTHPHLIEPFARQVLDDGAFRAFTHPLDNGIFIASRASAPAETK
jgi:predicted O-methyltransferase YrrM